MSLLDKSSIVLPRGAASKAGDIAAWNPQTQEIVSLGITQATPNLTIVNEDGLIESVGENILPRDFRNGGCGEFIFWPQRTNRITLSNNLTTWFKIGTPVVNNTTALDPKGTNTACNVTMLSGERFSLSISGAASDSNYSIYIKGTGTYFVTYSTYIGSTTDKFTATAEYQRIDFNMSGVAASSNFQIRCDVGGTADFWGIQVEEGTYPTAVIETNGSTETREQIQLSESGLSNLIGQSEGGLYFEYKPFVTDEDSFIALSDGTFNNRVVLGINGGTARYRYIVVSGGVTSADLSPPSPTPSVDSYSKYGIRYSEDDFALYVDGSSIAVDDSGSTFSGSTLDVLSFDNGAGGAILEGSIIGLSVFNSNPTNTQLSEITT